MLYYHTGQDGQWGYDSTPWWQDQDFPASQFTPTGTGDRSVFLTNWENVVTEMGNRYGTLLDGWFFDDGMIYYPAPYEALGAAAKSGNPNRLISFNPWVASRETDFQDVWFGEGSKGQAQYGSAASGSNGVFTSGPLQGLLQHGMFPMEQDWGVYAANQPITTQITGGQAITWTQSAMSRNVPVTFNLMMWQGGICSGSSLSILSQLRNAVYNNLVSNGAFETPSVSSYAQYAPGSSAIPGWQILSNPPDGVQIGAAGAFGATNGSQTLQLTGGSNYSTGGAIRQTIATLPGATYNISVDIASRNGNSVSGSLAFGSQQVTLTSASKTFTTCTWQMTASGTSTDLTLAGATNSATNQLLIDDVSVSLANPVPMVQTPAAASSPTVTGSTTSLSALGASSNGAAEPTLLYTWSVTSMPSGAGTPVFSANGTAAAKNTTVTFSGAGTYAFEVTITDTAGLSTTSSVNVTVNTPFQNWQAAEFGANANTLAISGATANPAGDGVCNLLKYAFAENPLMANAVDVPMVSASNGNLILSYRRNDTATDLTYTVQQSSDLVNWTAANPNTAILSDNGVYQIIQASVPENGAAALMLRLIVTLQE
jgi:hypothetical protein